MDSKHPLSVGGKIVMLHRVPSAAALLPLACGTRRDKVEIRKAPSSSESISQVALRILGSFCKKTRLLLIKP